MEKYARQKVIGKGSYGQAVVVKRKSDGVVLVMKEVRLQGLSKEERREARAECELLSRLKHPNIIQYIEHFEQRQVLYIVMEYAEKGDMDGMLKRYAQKQARVLGGYGKGLPQEQALHYFTQICMGMRYLHEKKILHRDIKCANIFLTASNVVKIGDFGISTILRNTFALARTVCGTPYYFSPELCQNRPYNNKSDVWAIGCVFYELLTLRHPFDGQNMKQLMQRIIKGTPSPVSTTYEKEVRDLVSQMLSKNDKSRPNMGQVLGTPVMRASLEKLQQGLGQATVRMDKLPNFKELLARHAQIHPKPQPGHLQPHQNNKKGPSPSRLSPRANAVDPVRGVDPRRPQGPKDIHPNAVKKAEDAKRFDAIAEKGKEVAMWYQKEQNKRQEIAQKRDELNPDAAKGRHGANNPGHRRRGSAPVTSPTTEANRPTKRPPPLNVENPRGHGRRGTTADREAEEQERQYDQKQREKVKAVNGMLLGADKKERDGSSSDPGSRPGSGPQHGRRATEPQVSPSADQKPVPPEGGELHGQSQFVALDQSSSSEDEEDEEDTELNANRRMEEYKQMMTDIGTALKKPGGSQDFGEDADCPPALAPQTQADPPKFILAGATLRLDVAPTAPLSQRSEVLREFIDKQIGTDVFIKAYRLISDGDYSEELTSKAVKIIGEPNKQLVPLIAQLVYCDDQVNLNQS
eukprot:TRINITY_DN2984_c0_g2_i1.p1 TRINITY_DN2984_c0_g2~~TRINITY_DN2984_c0_g2_i1.p1  ORF type:complete len:718 (+),score=117.00 TRINITY_DN2984_c0_g2_i1:83-2155(+)